MANIADTRRIIENERFLKTAQPLILARGEGVMSRVLEEADDAEVLVETHSFEGAAFASLLQHIAVLYQQEKIAYGTAKLLLRADEPTKQKEPPGLA